MKNWEMTWKMTCNDQREDQPVLKKLQLQIIIPRVDLHLWNENAAMRMQSFADDPIIKMFKLEFDINQKYFHL